MRDEAADFSDRGRQFQRDRGRRFSAIVDASGVRASEGFNVAQSSTISLKQASTIAEMRSLPRGFLPWGLSNTCPQGGAMRTAVARDGQVSDNPKHQPTVVTGGFLAARLVDAALEAITYRSPERGPTEAGTHGWAAIGALETQYRA